MSVSEANPSELEMRIEELEVANMQARQEHAELLKRIIKLEQAWTERESKKNRKFQTRCIQIAKEVLNEEPIIKYHPPFLNGLELDAFFQKYRIALEVQGLSIGFIALAGIKMSKNLRTSLIVIGKRDAFVKIMESSFL